MDNHQAVSTKVADGQREPVLIGVRDAARILGISRSFAYELVARRELPSARIGRRVLVPVAALSAFIAEVEAEARHAPGSSAAGR